MLNRRGFIGSMLATGTALPFLGRSALGQSGTGTLRIGSINYPLSLTPGLQTNIPTQSVMMLTHRGLLAYNVKGEIEGELAESWVLDNDRSWRFILRPAKFSDGSPVTAQDVAYSVTRLQSKEFGSSIRSYFDKVENVEVLDNRTFVIHTSEPDTIIPVLCTHPQFLIVKKDSDKLNPTGIGAGPYVVESYENGVRVRFVKSPTYFKRGLPRIEKIDFIAYPDESARATALIAGDVDMIDYVPYHAYDQIAGTAGLALDKEVFGGLIVMTFSGRGVFADKRLRRAAAIGIDRQAFVDTVLYGQGAPLNGVPRRENSPFYEEANANYWRYDPNQARKLMAEAGYPNGFKCTMLAASNIAFQRDGAVLIQQQLGEIGIRVELLMSENSSKYPASLRGEGDLNITGGGMDSLDPTAFIRFQNPELLPIEGARGHSFKVPGLTDLLSKGAAEMDASRRIAIYKEADRVSLEHTAFCGLAARATAFGRKKKLQGFDLYPDALSPYSMHSLDRAYFG
jgi:peptide/nickel transport system substrate-binding protein